MKTKVNEEEEMESIEAQNECGMIVEAQKEHQWLHKLVGEWTFEGEMTMEPDKPSGKFNGTESVRKLGDVWIVAEAQGEMPGGGLAFTMMTLGYDTQKQHYVGTFIGSMMTNLWIYEGTLDADERVLTLDTEGPNMAAEGKLAKFRDVIEVKSNDHRVLTSHMLGDDGVWRQFMTGHYRRKK